MKAHKYLKVPQMSNQNIQYSSVQLVGHKTPQLLWGYILAVRKWKHLIYWVSFFAESDTERVQFPQKYSFESAEKFNLFKVNQIIFCLSFSSILREAANSMQTSSVFKHSELINDWKLPRVSHIYMATFAYIGNL